MKILHFIYDSPQNPWCGGGGAIRTWRINSILSKRHEIELYCGSFKGCSHYQNPFPVHYIKDAKGYIESRLKFIIYSALILREKRRLYDIIVEDFSPYAPIIPLYLKKSPENPPLITTIHAHYGIEALRLNGFLGVMSIVSEKIILRQRKYAIVVSPHLKKAVPNASHIAVIGQGVDIPSLPEATEEFVLFLGRLDIRVKGLDLLLKAWAMIPENKRKFPLLIAGSGSDDALNKINSMIRHFNIKDIKILPKLSHNDAMRLINRAAFACMPSRSEGFGLVAAETLSIGRPVIASHLPSLSSIITDGEDGILFPAGDVNGLCSAIKRLMTDELLRRRMAKNAMRKKGLFDWDRVASLTEDFYLKVLSSC